MASNVSRGHVWMWELDCEESRMPKNWCFWTVVLEKTPECPLDCKEIQPVHSEGDQPWDFFGRTDAEAETPVLWPPHAKSWLIGKDSDARRDWGQEEKGTTEDEMAGWHHRFMACCDSWGRKESDSTELLNWRDAGVGGDRWDGWMASLTRWMWVWVNSRSWWWTSRPGVVQFMGLQRVRHEWATELNWMFPVQSLNQSLIHYLQVSLLCYWFYKRHFCFSHELFKKKYLFAVWAHGIFVCCVTWDLLHVDSSCGVHAQQLQHEGLVAPWRVGSSFLNQASNLGHLQCKVDRFPLDHQGNSCVRPSWM